MATKQKKAFLDSQFQGKDQLAQTPTEVMVELVSEFGLLNDVCPPNYTRDMLVNEWESVNYMNPPYNNIPKWLDKAIEQWKMNKTVVALLPARTNSGWFHEKILPYATEIRFIRNGIRFKGYKKKSPFPLCLVIYKAEDAKEMEEENDVKIGSVDFYPKKKRKKINNES